MEKEDLFLDTCVFFSYAYIFEDFSHLSEKIFKNADYNKYTGKTVDEEIEARLKKRNKTYLTLVTLLSKGASLEEISSSSFGIYLSSNDINHLKSLIDYLNAQIELEDILSEFRRWKLISDTRIKKARQSLIGVVPKCTDSYKKDLIKSIINNDPDSKIVMEAFEWSKPIENPKFVTIDTGDIYKNSAKILETLVNYSFLDKDPFSILHVVEFITSSEGTFSGLEDKTQPDGFSETSHSPS